MAASLNDIYENCLMTFEAHETKHRVFIDDYLKALKSGRPAETTKARVAVKDSEKALVDAHYALVKAHLQYWRQREADLMPELRAAAELIHRFNRVAKAAAREDHRPGMSIISSILDNLPPAVVAIDVPETPPDEKVNELILDYHDVWRRIKA